MLWVKMEILDDVHGIAHALRLAEKGLFITTPNPRVGCVIAKGRQIVGEGFTQPAGQAHAEIQAISDAAARGFDTRGATVYVTLEPCSHQGRTGPCADALIRAGVGRVVVAIGDPNPLVSGQGLSRLREAGIEVACGVMEEQARELNIGFFSRMQRGKPWVRMKIAASLDGRTALHDGSSQWITAPAARDDGHWWRARACAIVTGIGTVIQDDPQMTVRAVPTPRQPRRIVIDSQLRISADARILAGDATWIVCARSDPEKEARLCERGAEVILLPTPQGKVDFAALMQELARRQINELHVEAGGKLNGALIRESCVDELLLYMAPSLLGDARDMFDLGRLAKLDDKRSLSFHEVRQIGPDLRILARFN
jgi:diaminohydroxyphosphoribosylaminopyrimidine deaminase/5-amino-6-(5-phosphoribosylamino)uracil reductase